MNIFKRFIADKVSQVKDWQANGEDKMRCPEIVISGVDADLYAKLLSEANAAGVAFNGNEASVGDIRLQWEFDLESTTLRVTPLHKPLLVPCGTVESKIRALVDKAKTAI